jgi:hypothetical protein
MATVEEMNMVVAKFIEDLWTAIRLFHNYKNDCPEWVMWVELSDKEKEMFMKWILDVDLIDKIYEIGHDMALVDLLENKTN